MVRDFVFSFARFRCILLAFGVGALLNIGIVANAMDDSSAATKQADTATDESDEPKDDPAETEEEDAAIEIPDGTAEELFAFASETMRNRGRTRESVLRSARAVVDTAAKIREMDDISIETELKAIGIQMPALKFLARIDRDARAELEELIESFAEDKRPEIRNFAVMEKLVTQVRGVRGMDTAEQKELVGQVLQIADESGINSQLYSIASQLAAGLSAADQTDMAVKLYNNIADRMEDSDDERMQQMASRARGSARRIGLLGNEMELEGTTAEGEAFDWSEYRGRVVLVDFWASWCGPCRGEIPNMKRNLEAYGDEFAIVGINMDRTVKAMQECIEEEEIQWVNLVGDKETGTGWDHPIARYYGVSGIPTAILVDREGKVVSLSARGKRLDASLEELLGPPKKIESPEADSDTEEGSGDDSEDGEEATS
ncbi:TlpA family protein disulfide reductase [Rhodopirellula sallentina]|uniref:Alkyl hydroperoxide reductase/ thiol specific antioxidant/ Mal allergen n=1 Tax=Rhodopirellula sallentina SM41 TaxID=1263870 RepID=M5TWP2_9BACT|nr:TlpA disulfide reductase family protein [Rhodopirellula sallentina]EMI53595.1 alkyl hydroperoxide reductase/ thiol specific antioxidant/ Mal allergen [Rhodopirellula sallentina SM41]